ncbi:hypothetical protein [Streptomyces gobiensis]|uniref:hypothetical protein n=1 Tax=Streptomyces gobiensis TaxID=2875706 RepID=UPI001E2B73BF|nr:hypothetical protein [Streptomyces gobiensis]UGY94341.1 hypothetical protein test1122_23150 [Streptomyces gobiensis]
MTDGPTARQLPHAIAAFAAELRALVGALDPGSGWYGVFAQRDPEGIRACLDGREVPPWDVVDALLQDLAGRHGMDAAERMAQRLRWRYGPSVTAHDTELGGPSALRERLDSMVRARDHASRRVGELNAAMADAEAARDPAERDRLAADLAWTRDDLERATARCAELRERLAARSAQPAPSPIQPSPIQPSAAHPGAGAPGNPAGEAGEPAAVADSRQPTADPGRPAGRPRRPARPRGSRFAGLATDDPAPEASAPAATAVPPGAGPGAVERSAPAPRGARFAGVQDDGETTARHPAPRTPADPARMAAIRRTVDEAVDRLTQLRAAGRGGEAYGLLCAAARWPAEQLPVLAAALERAGLAADVTTLLWEAACLPPEPLAAAADALASAGHQRDCGQLLRQSVSRPVHEVAATALSLSRTGRDPEATELLAALLRARTPEEAVTAVTVDPAGLRPLLVAAAESISPGHRRDIEGVLAREV